MFLGTYDYTIDQKGRLFLPAKLRDGAPPYAKASGGLPTVARRAKVGRFIVTRGLEECLYIFDAGTFDNVILKRLENLPVKNQQDGRAFKRLLLSGAQDLTLDEMGRMVLPKALIDFASLKTDVVILGVGERIELWSAAKWKTYSGKAASTFQKLGKHLEI